MARSVTAATGPEPNGEMNAIGLLVAALSAVILLPLIPFLAVLKVASWLRGGQAG